MENPSGKQRKEKHEVLVEDPVEELVRPKIFIYREFIKTTCFPKKFSLQENQQKISRLVAWDISKKLAGAPYPSYIERICWATSLRVERVSIACFSM